MNSFTIHTTQTAPEGSREALEQLERRVGFVPNLAATIADSPVAMQGFGALQGSLRRSSLTVLEREVVGITVSYANRSGYSMAAHCTFAAGAGAEDAVLTALRTGDDVPDPRLRAVQRFTGAVLAAHGHVSDEELAAFEDAGFSREQVLEVIAQMAYTTLANLAANVTSTPIDEAFQPQAEVIAAA